MNKADDDSDIESDLDGPDAESLPLHNLQGSSRQPETSPADAFVDSPAAAPPENKGHRPTAYLDGLRGLAAFFVYFYHHLSWFYGPQAPFVWGLGHEGKSYIVQLPFIRVLFSGGNAAVAIFFVLSGYVLSVSPLQKLHNGHLRKFYTGLASAVIRRPFRLYIPVIGVSLVFAISMHLPFGLAPIVGWPEPEKDLLAEFGRWLPETARVLNPFQLLGITKPWYVYDPPAYTMAIEYAGSMLVFGLLAALSRVSSKIKLITFMVLGLLLLATYQWAFCMFLVGMTLALNDIEGYDHWLMARLSARAISIIHHSVFVVGWYLLSQPSGPMDPKTSYETPGWWLLSQLIPPNYWGKEYWRWWNTWGALCMVYAVLRINWLQRFFTTRPLAYLGRLSFMLYLTQAPILWTFADRIFRLFGQIQQQDLVTWWDARLSIPDWGIHGLTSRFVLSQIIVLPVQFLLADIATRLIDAPSISIGRWIVGKLGIENK